MTNQLSHEASRLIEHALREEPIPPPAELARIRRSLLRISAAMAVTAGASPLAAQTVATKAAWLGFLAKSPFAGAVVVGMSIGMVTLGGGSWVARQIEQREPRQVSNVAARATASAIASSQAVFGTAAPASVPPFVSSQYVPQSAPALQAAIAARSDDETPVVEAKKVVSMPTDSGTRIIANVARAPNAPTITAAATQAAPTTVAVARFDSTGRASISEVLSELELAQRALSRGNPQLALTLLERLDASEAGDAMLDERLGLETLAACQTGQIDRAQRAARRLLRHRPQSPLAARIRTSCVADEGR
jgi:hypothetical protein